MTPPLPAGPFDILYADPPWSYNGRKQFGFAGDVGVDTGGAVNQYRTLTPEELCDIDVASLRALRGSLLFCWTTGPMAWTATPPVIEAWGFEIVTCAFVWNKVLTNPGYYTLSQCEFCLVAKDKRIPQPRGTRNERQWLETVERVDWDLDAAITHLREGHSAKPPEIRDAIARMFPTQRKLELFARGQAPEGWTFWGNEAA